MLGRLVLPTLIAVALLAGCASPAEDEPGRAAAPAATPAPSAAPSPLAPTAAAPAPPEPVAPPAPEPEPAPELPSGPIELLTAILPGGFEHPSIEVPVGSTITWANVDSQTHSVVSSDGTFSGSGPLAPGMSFQRTFQTPGTHPFYCRFHDGMTGTIVVA